MASQTQDAIFSCSGTVTKCTAPFASAFAFEVVETISNGDCFFDSLLQSGEIEEPGKSPKEQKNQRLLLRKRLVDYLENPDILASLSEFGFNNIEKNIQQLRKEKVYACDAGDLPTQFAHEAFGIHLNVYVIDYHKGTKRTVVTLERHQNIDPMAPTIHVLRIGQHFKLLQPTIPPNQLEHRIQRGIEQELPYYQERRRINTGAANKIKQSLAKHASNNANTSKKGNNNNNLQKALAASLANAGLANKMGNMTLKNNSMKKKQENENAALAKKLNMNRPQSTQKISKLNSALMKLSSGKTYENLNRYEKTAWTKFQKK